MRRGYSSSRPAESLRPPTSRPDPSPPEHVPYSEWYWRWVDHPLAAPVHWVWDNLRWQIVLTAWALIVQAKLRYPGGAWWLRPECAARPASAASTSRNGTATARTASPATAHRATREE